MINKKPLNYCGVLAEDMTAAAKDEYSVINGIYVNEVRADSPAFDAGIRSGDIILQVDDKVIIDTNNFYNTISTYKPEDEITIQIKRTTGTADKLNDVKVVLAEKKNE
jgi:S1-C subfamily serine protease